MVFDNPLGGTRARNPAKLQEAERRRTQRELVSRRASLERNRNRRIQRLSALIQRYTQLNPSEGNLLHRELRRLHREASEQDERDLNIGSEQQHNEVQQGSPSTVTVEAFDNDWDEENPAAFDEIVDEEILQGAQVLTSLDEVFHHQQIDFGSSQADGDVNASISALAHEFLEIRLQFGRLHPSHTKEADATDGERSDAQVVESKKQAALTSAEARIHEAMLNRGLHDSEVGVRDGALSMGDVQLPYSDEDDGDTTATEMSDKDVENEPAVPDVLVSALSPEQTESETETSMLASEESSQEESDVQSKNDERQTSTSTPEPQEVTDQDVQEIHEQSATLSKSYNRASTPLTSQIIIDCAYLCALLGVPVLFTSQGRSPSRVDERGRSTIPGAAWAGVAKSKSRAHEAEALAASLVHAGFADVVASEDSDVLMYDVPMLRGLLGGGGPAAGGMKGLVWVDAKEVRRTIFDEQGHQASAVPRTKKDRSRLPAPVDIDAVLDEAIRARSDDATEAQLDTSTGLQHTGDLELPTLGEPSRPDEEVVAEQHDDADSADVLIEPDEFSDTLVSAEIEHIMQLSADGWNRRRFLEFALLLGTDFNRTIPGVGPKTAYTLMKEHGSIAQILRLRNPAPKQPSSSSKTPSDQKVRAKVNEYKFSPPPPLSRREYSKELTRARDVFAHPPTLVGYLGRLGRWSRGQEYYDWRKAAGIKLPSQGGTLNGASKENQADAWRRAEMLALFRRNGLHKSPLTEADSTPGPFPHSQASFSGRAIPNDPFSTSNTSIDTAESSFPRLSTSSELDSGHSPFGSDLFGERNVPSRSEASALLLKTTPSSGRKRPRSRASAGS
ncbi:hypothetical protein OC846_001819 [Tilletia horrida]|uniref:XPG-I domain-containing protein n=1 Tax=Tilletia horrida TaxID=155126 RepID=A0AAN6JZI6_9BASI|nr:hypothetical protein OC846_001819 [Tilletia horrida]KAK0568408.1 hypothetical protein OC861_001965 [Tilletia horrida]